MKITHSFKSRIHFSLAFSLIFISFVLTSCSKKAITKSQFKLSLGYLSSQSVALDGGIFIKQINKKNGEVIVLSIKPDQEVFIPSSTYDFLFVVYQGPGFLTGTKTCSMLSNIIVEGELTTIDVSLKAADCSLPKMSEFILEIEQKNSGKWDEALWDQSLFAP